MELITPGIGLLFWMLLSFSLVFYILAKFAWKPIINSLNTRDQSIDSALRGAQEARELAQKEAHQIIENARLSIENEKKNALSEIKDHISQISLQVAEHILRKKLVSTNEQNQYIEELLKDIKAN